MKYKVNLIILSILPILILAQNNYDPFRTEDEKINSYYHKIDSIATNIDDKYSIKNLKLSYKYAENTKNFRNIITTNYWVNDTKVNFLFKDDNLSYLTPENFDNFRRQFYKNESLNVFVFIENQNIEKYLHTKILPDKKVKYFKNKDIVIITEFFPQEKRFLIFNYYFKDDNLVKIKICELNPEFQWDKINYTEFYYDKAKIIYTKFYQSLMDGRFSLDSNFTKQDLNKISMEILTNINPK